tara:strand:+ start:226 stop:564 length:339 start_codon:yes stop_codon:yes gene_type:complete
MNTTSVTSSTVSELLEELSLHSDDFSIWTMFKKGRPISVHQLGASCKVSFGGPNSPVTPESRISDYKAYDLLRQYLASRDLKFSNDEPVENIEPVKAKKGSKLYLSLFIFAK